ncbi:MAG: flagellar hook-basal body complex protein FliE [Desulfobaccales bacterium]
MKINPFGIVNKQDTKVSEAETPDSPTGGFGVFRMMLADAQHKQSQADTQVQRSLLGEADIHEAILALEHADLSLRLLVQVRNKLIQAYEELSRMNM